MERKHTPRIITEGSGDSDHNLHFSFHNNQPYADEFFNTDAGWSFQAVPNVNLTQTTPFHVFHGFPDNSIGSSLDLPYVFTSDPPLFSQMPATTPYLIQGESQLKSFPDLPDNLKTPKLETFSEVEDRFNFGPHVSNRALMLCNPSFNRLPVRPPVNHVPSSARNFHLQHDFHAKESLRGTLRQSSSSSSNTNLPLLNPALMPQSMLARMRRKKISDKTRCLQKLLPVEKKMDIATMLGEAYKYIKFLKAQLSALESMPCESSFTFQIRLDDNVSGYAGLDRLNRQQLLQVLVNSPVAQTLLYTKERCIVSLEQLILLKQISDQTRGLPQQALLLGR